jgi:hypothetical protein
MYIPKIKDRLKMEITLTPNFTAMVTAHGKTRAYLHHFKIIDPPACPCDNGIDLIYECGKLNIERRKLIADVPKAREIVLVNNYPKQITHFTNSINYENM